VIYPGLVLRPEKNNEVVARAQRVEVLVYSMTLDALPR